MSALGGALLVARRELRALATTPVLWVVATLFLVVQGFSFWAVLQVLSDPRAPAPLGAVLRTHFGGTVLYWAFLFFVVAAVTMRAIAEERAAGTWEPLLTTRLGLGAIVAGKWLGALAFYALLWAPTLLYVVVLASVAPPGVSIDPGPVIGAYAGVLAIGAAATAIGIAASAGAGSQIVAATVTFVALLAVLLAGAAPELAPAWFARHAGLAAVADVLDLRRTMDDAARGVLELARLGPPLLVAAAALVIAGQLAGATRRAADARARGAIGGALAAVAALLAAVVLARHPVRVDLTRDRAATPAAAARALVAALPRTVRVTIVPGQGPGPRAAWPEIEVAVRALVDGARVELARVEPLVEPERAEALAIAFRVEPERLTDEGALLVEADGDDGDVRREAVELGALLDAPMDAPIGMSAEPPGLRVDAALAPAIARIAVDAATRVCVTQGAGEPALTASPDGRDLTVLAQALARVGVSTRAVDGLASGIPPACTALAIVGPRRALTLAEAGELDAWLARGGRLLVAVDAPAPDAVATGLEVVLASTGIRLLPAVAVDPAFDVGAALAWGTTAGYGVHPSTRGWSGRLTVWRAPRALAATGAAKALVTTSPTGWAEHDLGSLGDPGEGPGTGDAPGPVPVAVASEGKADARVVVLGSARSLESRADDGRSETAAFAAAAVRWLVGSEPLAIASRRPERVTLALSRGALGTMFLWLVLLGPGAVGAAGAAWLAWRKRR